VTSSARGWWLLLGGFVVFVVLFSLLERLVGSESSVPTVEQGTGAATSPALPVVRMPEDGGVEIRHDLLRRTRIRLESEEKDRALFDCLTRGLEETFASGTEGWDPQKVRDETRRVQEECMGAQGVPVPPRPLRPPAAGG
jgi:hypothetical protein